MFFRNHFRSRGTAKLFAPLYLMLVVCLALAPAARGLARGPLASPGGAPASPIGRLPGLHGYFDNMPPLLLLPAGVREVRAVGGSAAAGQNTTVAVELVSQGDENALGFSVTFDPTKLTYVASVKGADAGPATMNVNAAQAAAGRVGVALALNAGESFAAGTRQLVVLTFTPQSTATGTTAAVGFGDTPVAREVADANANVLATTFTPGGVIVIYPTPVLTSLSPPSTTAGAAAFTLTLNGSGFFPASVIRWNGTARTTTYGSPTQLTTQVEAAEVSVAGTVNVTVFNPTPGGGESAASTFTINNPLPVATTLSTSVVVAGGAGFNLTVGGSNFVPTSVVRWNGTDRATTYVSSTQLTAAVNAADIASAGAFNVTVFNPAPGGGTSAPLVFTVNAPASITSLAPSSATAGAEAFTLTVNGSGFVSGSKVRWNGSERVTTFVGSTQLTAAVTAADVASAGTFTVTVLNPEPGGSVSAGSTFTVNNPTPSLGSVSPSSATAGDAAFTLTLNGLGFVPTSVVRWNGTARTTTFVNSTQLTTQITSVDISTPGSAEVTVFNPAPGGGTSSVQSFTINSPPLNVRAVRVAAATGRPGDPVNVPLELTAQGDENALGFSIAFDPAQLSFNSAAKGGDAGVATLGVNTTQAGAGRVGVTLALPAGQTFAAGVRQIVLLNFNVGTGVSATSVGVGFGDQPVTRAAAAANSSPLNCAFVPGTLTVTQGYEADVSPRPNGDNNGTVTIGDWNQIGQFAAFNDTPAAGGPGGEFQRADCAPRETLGDGQVRVSDWVQAGRYASLLDPATHAGGPTSPASAATAAAHRALGAGSRDVHVVNTSIKKGETGAVAIELDAAGDENALGFNVTFDASKLAFVSAAKGVDAGSTTLNVNASQVASGRVGFAQALPAGESFAAGKRQLILLTFRAIGTEGSTTVGFGSQPVASEVVDAKANVLSATYTPGAVSITLPPANGFKFEYAEMSAFEWGATYNVMVTRTGDLSAAASVDYATADGTAKERSDYTTADGTLEFAPGESQKSFPLLVTQDSNVEGPETMTITLSNPTGSMAVITPSVMTCTIADDATEPDANMNDDTETFVRQHYHDFLNREPDAPGLAFWMNEINQCGGDAQCKEVKRINVSAAFFLSIEFQQTGYYVYRLYKAALPPAPTRPLGLPRYRELLRDTQEVGRGVVVLQGDWELKLEQNKRRYAEGFVQRPEFLAIYPASLGAAEFVDALNANAGGALTQAERDQLVAGLASGAETRATVLRKVAETEQFTKREFNRAFVLMQYVGYLRRSPNDAPDTDLAGYNYWLGKLDSFGGNYIRAEMVKAFISSIEYRSHFGKP